MAFQKWYVSCGSLFYYWTPSYQSIYLQTTARRNALAILDMFDVGVCHLIDGRNIDRPKNAVTLTQRCHAEFGTFHMYFEAVPDAPVHTYTIQ